MELESVKRYLEKGGGDDDKNKSTMEEMPLKFFERFIMQGLRADLIEPGHVICSMNVPARLLNADNFMHGEATATLVNLVGSAAIFTVGASSTGVSVEISVSCLGATFGGEEIEIESKVLRVGKAIAVVRVEFRKKDTEKIVAQGRHTKQKKGMVSEDFSFPKKRYQLPNLAVTPWLWRVSSTVYPADYYEGEAAAADDQFSECEEKMDMLGEDFNEELQRVCSLKDKKMKEAAAVAPVNLSNDQSAARAKMVELYCMQPTGSGMIRDKRSSKTALLVIKFLKKLFSITSTHQNKTN